MAGPHPDQREHSNIVGLVIVVVSSMSFLQTSIILSVIFSYKDMFRSSYHVLIGYIIKYFLKQIKNIILNFIAVTIVGPYLLPALI